MFHNHQKQIETFAQSSADNFARVLTFVILTIRMPLYRVVDDMQEVDKLGSEATCLWGFKREAYDYVQANKDRIYAEAMELNAIADPFEAERQLIAFFAAIPGFGLAKGGFVVQLCFGLGGCLDTHNVIRFGLREQDIKASRFKGAKTWKTKYQLLDVYQDLLKACGGCAKLWDSWCEYVANNQPGTYQNAFHVSQLHCEAIGLS
jgi:hypothetical protein